MKCTLTVCVLQFRALTATRVIVECVMHRSHRYRQRCLSHKLSTWLKPLFLWLSSSLTLFPLDNHYLILQERYSCAKMVILLLSLICLVLTPHTVKAYPTDLNRSQNIGIESYNATVLISRVIEALGGASALADINHGLTYSAPKSVSSTLGWDEQLN